MASSSSLPPQDRSNPPSLPHPPSPVPPPKPIPAASRRLPPPCWSHDETVALIDSYRGKWYSLRRGNLKANHWQEVADAVAVRCPLPSPPKTSVQCRHKMEKLRKRYRTELNRSLSAPNRNRTSSSWVHFHRMHSMEKGTSSSATAAVDSGTDSPDEDDEEDDNNGVEDHERNDVYSHSAKHGFPYNRTPNSAMVNGTRSGLRIKFPGGPSAMAPPSYGIGIRGGRNHENPNPNFGSRVVRDLKEAMGSKREREGEGDAVAEMVEAVKVLGDGFVKIEKMKMEMARETEAMRMEMEMKRTQMILESQQRVVEAFAKGFTEKKKKKAAAKRMPSPES